MHFVLIDLFPSLLHPPVPPLSSFLTIGRLLLSCHMYSVIPLTFPL